MDFVHDQLAMGTKLRILSRYAPVVDRYARTGKQGNV